MLLTAGLFACSSAPAAPAPAAQVALHGPVSTRGADPGATRCECDVSCTATSQEFVGLSALNASDACARARVLCRAAGCTTCVQTGPGFCE